MSRAAWMALLLSLAAVLAGAFVAHDVYQDMAHLEDEFAYLWQAQAAAEGDLTLPSPEYENSFLVPFVVDYHGRRFGKYPLGWPALLSLGISLGVRSWINPLLGGLAVWLIFRLGQAVFNDTVGVIAAGLSVTSPFFLIQSGSLLSHPWSLALSTAFILSWLNGFVLEGDRQADHRWLAGLVSGMCLGVLALTRPLTAAAVGLPLGLHGSWLLVRGRPDQRRRVLLVGGVALGVGSLHFLWQYAVTGEWTRNPYTLWWSYDVLGFGPGVGVTEEGHNLQQAWWNTKHSLRSGLSDLFGWGRLSWLFLPFGIWAARDRPAAYPLAAVPLTLVLAYGAYWVGSWLLGPRYYYEALPALAVFSAAGICWLGGWSVSREGSRLGGKGWSRVRPLLVAVLVGLLVTANLRFYLPARVGGLRGLYTIQRSDLEPFQDPDVRELAPALIIVHADPWMSYGSLLELNDPYRDSPLLFAWSLSPRKDARLAADYRGIRDVYHYYPDRDPGVLYTAPPPVIKPGIEW